MNHAQLHVLAESEIKLLRKIVDASGVAGAARVLGVSRGVVASAAGSIGVRRGSIELIREALAAYRRNGASK